jgi:hypothetical protein
MVRKTDHQATDHQVEDQQEVKISKKRAGSGRAPT